MCNRSCCSDEWLEWYSMNGLLWPARTFTEISFERHHRSKIWMFSTLRHLKETVVNKQLGELLQRSIMHYTNYMYTGWWKGACFTSFRDPWFSIHIYIQVKMRFWFLGCCPSPDLKVVTCCAHTFFVCSAPSFCLMATCPDSLTWQCKVRIYLSFKIQQKAFFY